MSLSIILPSIRPEKVDAVFDATEKSYSGDFELIICGPNYPSPRLQEDRRVKFVRDFGSPVRASCIAASLAEKKYLTWTADDGVFLPGMLDKCMAALDPDNEKSVVIGKYTEGDSTTQPDEYFNLSKAYGAGRYIDPSWWIFNFAILSRKFFEEVGGWNCCYETTAFSQAEQAAQAQANGAKLEFIKENIVACGHMPGTSGDHAPIHYAHTQHDEPLYRQLNNSIPLNLRRPALDNWKHAPAVWQRRFA